MKAYYLFNCPEHGPKEIQLDSEEDNLQVQNCTDCGQSMLRMYTPPSVTFKGSGFYVNDYRGK